MSEVVLYERLDTDGSRIETKLPREQLAGDGQKAIVLGQINIGTFGGGQARFVVEAPDSGPAVKLRTSSGALESWLAVSSGQTVDLVARAGDLLHHLDPQTGEIKILRQCWRYIGDAEPKPRTIDIRLQIFSGAPLDIVTDLPEEVIVEAGAVDEIDEPVAFARVRVRNTRREAQYRGPLVGLAVRGLEDNRTSRVAPLAQALLMRRADERSSGTADWVSVDGANPLPLPLENAGTAVLEYGLPVSALRAWLRTGASGSGNPAINLRLAVVSLADGTEHKSHPLQLVIPIRGTAGDVLLLKTGNETVRTVLRPQAEAHVKRLETRVRTAPRHIATREFGLEPVVFEVTVMSNEPSWLLEPEATLTDHDSGERESELLDSEMLLINVPRAVSISLPHLANRLDARGCRLEHATLQVRFKLYRGPLPSPPGGSPADVRGVVLSLDVSVDRKLPSWMVCVDFGASAIAIGVAPGRADQRGGGGPGLGPLTVLPLGDWLKAADPNHPEIVQPRDELLTPRAERDAPSGTSVLLPSYIGLSSALNLRNRFDPISYGDLAAALDDSASQRLELLDREYDLSLPYPSSRRLSEEFGKIVFALKRDLASHAPRARTMSEVDARRGKVLERTKDIDVARLFADCFHELGTFLVPRVLRHATRGSGRGPPGMLPRFLSDIETDLNDSVGVVVTHPFGLDAGQLAIYREAGRRFLAGLMGCLPGDPDLGKVVPVPEALAAARYGLFRLLAARPPQIRGKQRIVCLDIGASTYDVTIIDADTRGSGPLPSWRILGHFGLLVGGADLDNAIAQRIIEIVEVAAEMPEVKALFLVETRLKPTNTQIDSADDPVLLRKQRNFLEALQRGKKHLADELFDAAGAYQWGEKRLRVEIGTNATPKSQDDDKPFACLLPQRFPQAGADPVHVVIADPPAELVYGRHRDGTPYVSLLIGPKAFESRAPLSWSDFPSGESADVGDLTDVLARRIPELAAASVSDANGVWWIVTGRAGLWPAIYAGIAGVARKHEGSILEKPFRPDEMKRAVLEGALRLAVETHLPLTTMTPPTLAIMTHDGDQPDFQPLEIEKPVSLSTGNRYALVRMLPGLDKVDDAEALRAAFQAAGLQPWSVLVQDIDKPKHKQISVERCATEQGDMVRVTADGVLLGKPYGPFHEDRIYG